LTQSGHGISATGSPRVVGYRRLDTAAEAIRFAIEATPSDLLLGAVLEVDEELQWVA